MKKPRNRVNRHRAFQSTICSSVLAAQMMPPEAAYFNYRDPQTLWGMLEEIAMYQRRFPLPRHPCARTSAPTCTGVGEHARVRPCTAAKKEGGSFVRGTEESDRAAPLAPAEVEIREGAVLRGSGGPEHQAASAVPSSANRHGRFCQPPPSPIERRTSRRGHTRSQEAVLLAYFFNTHPCFRQL